MATKKTVPKKKVSTPIKSVKKKSAEETVKKEPSKKLVGAKYLADCFGVSERRMQQICQEILTPEPGGKGTEGYQYDFAKSLIAIGRYYREKADNRKSSESIDLEAAKLEEKKIKIEKDSLELDELKKDLHRSADIERVVGAAMSRLRINLRGIPMGVAPLIKVKENENEIAEIIMDRIDRALSEVADIDIDDMMSKEEGAYSE